MDARGRTQTGGSEQPYRELLITYELESSVCGVVSDIFGVPRAGLAEGQHPCPGPGFRPPPPSCRTTVTSSGAGGARRGVGRVGAAAGGAGEDAQSRLLRQDAGEVLALLPRLSESGDHPKIRHELMQSTVEVVTGICSTAAEVKADLAATIGELQRITSARGTMLACAGTHPVSDWRDARMAPIQRYAELIEQMQWLARRIQTFGVHVHVGLRDGSKAIPIVNALAAYLPHFLALTASSPYWCGRDTGLASIRSAVFGAFAP